MTKKLKLTFSLEGNGTLSVTLSSPKEGLDAEALETAAASIVPVLESTSGAAATALAGAVYITPPEDVVL